MRGHVNQSRVLTSFEKYAIRKNARLGWFAHRIYKVFWNEISDCLLNTINYAYTEGKFSISQRLGIINNYSTSARWI